MKLNFNNLPPDSSGEEQLVGAFIREREERRLRERYVRQLAKQHGIHRPEAKQPQLKRRRLWSAAAAAVVALAIAAGLAWPTQGHEDYLAQQLDVNAYHLPQEREGDRAAADLSLEEQQILYDFGAGRYRAVINQSETTALTPRAQLYVGLAHLALEEPEAARAALGKVGGTGAVAAEAQWFIALLEIQAGDHAAGRKRLMAVPGNDLIRRRRADRLLDLLD